MSHTTNIKTDATLVYVHPDGFTLGDHEAMLQDRSNDTKANNAAFLDRMKAAKTGGTS